MSEFGVDGSFVAADWRLKFFNIIFGVKGFGFFRNTNGHVVTKGDISNARSNTKSVFGVLRVRVAVYDQQSTVLERLENWLFQLGSVLGSGDRFLFWHWQGNDVILRDSPTFRVVVCDLFRMS